MDGKHFIAAACLVENTIGEILLIKGPRRGWECPGGLVQPGESIIEGAVRETLEETGCDVRVGKLATVHTNLDNHSVGFGFLATYLSGQPTTSPESLDVKWVARSHVLDMITFAPIRQRMVDMLSFSGEVIYRSYHRDPYLVAQERTI